MPSFFAVAFYCPGMTLTLISTPSQHCTKQPPAPSSSSRDGPLVGVSHILSTKKADGPKGTLISYKVSPLCPSDSNVNVIFVCKGI